MSQMCIQSMNNIFKMVMLCQITSDYSEKNTKHKLGKIIEKKKKKKKLILSF